MKSRDSAPKSFQLLKCPTGIKGLDEITFGGIPRDRPTLGDSTQGIDPGTAFENLPDSWTCPVCGAQKSEFVKEGEAGWGREARFI